MPAIHSHAKKILIVNSDENTQLQLFSSLTLFYQVSVVECGLDALNFLKDNNVDLIISSFSLPQLDGLQLLRMIRSTPTLELTPFLLLLEPSQKQFGLNALNAGVDHYMIQPFNLHLLVAWVRNIINNFERRKKAFSTGFSSPQSARILVADSLDTAASNYRSSWLQSLHEVIQAELQNSKLTVTYLAHKLAVSERTLRNRIKTYTGLSPQQFILEERLRKARILFEEGTYSTITEVMYAVGMRSNSYFARVFREYFGVNPSEYVPYLKNKNFHLCAFLWNLYHGWLDF
ncbi:helix-turn-helix domain-containing protein [Haliscomenobacter sp.]|uniref:helix-turn-helix domain-containing protein n=1 Tax=Haliscomenobacter sp. TaxID=2717303 RepID=UPI003BA89471